MSVSLKEVDRLIDLNKFLLMFYLRDRDVSRSLTHAWSHVRLLWLRRRVLAECVDPEWLS